MWYYDTTDASDATGESPTADSPEGSGTEAARITPRSAKTTMISGAAPEREET